MLSGDAEFRKKDERVRQLGEKVARLNKEISRTEDEVRERCLKQIQVLCNKKRIMQDRFDRLKNSNERCWEIVEAELEKAISDLKIAIGAAGGKRPFS